MLLKLFSTKDQDIILPILRHPELFKLIDGQDETIDINSNLIDSSFDYVVISLDDKIIGCFSFKPMTNTVVEGHIRLLPDVWKTGISLSVMEAGTKYLLENTSYRKIITLVPGNCTHVINLLKKCVYKLCGSIHEGIVYNKKLTSLLFFEFDLNRG